MIGARGEVGSIIFVSAVPPRELDGATIWVPTASATSVLLLKILLRVHWRVEVEFRWFDQGLENPFSEGARAALFIGDVALRPDLGGDRTNRLDLGAEWLGLTGLPFAFAVWQTTASDAEAAELHRLLVESRTFAVANRQMLARRYARHFRMDPDDLERYWAGLIYQLDEQMVDGLGTFYRLGHEIGELSHVPPLAWAT